MASSMSNQTNEDAFVSKTFAALWAALQNSYEGTNITRTVARLLHMYQPEDGTLAYERLLRTLYVLLEGFDNNGLRLLLSMVPPPKDNPESAIQEIFQKATGFTRITSPVSHDYFISSAKEIDIKSQVNNMKVDLNHKDMIQCLKSFPTNRGDGFETFNRSPQTISPDQVDFRGFPSKEICNTETRIQNINQFHELTSANCIHQTCTCGHRVCHQPFRTIQDQQNSNSSGAPIDYRMKWIYTPYLLRKNAICQSTQIYQDPLVIFQSADQQQSRISTSQLNQFQRDQSHTNQESLRNFKKPILIDLSKDQEGKMDVIAATNSQNVHLQEGCKNLSIETEKNVLFEMKVEKESQSNEKKVNLEEVKLIQRAIQEDIFRMDVVQTDFVEPSSPAFPEAKILEPEDLDISNELRESVTKFLQRVKNEETISIPVESKQKVSNPPTRSTVSDETSAFIDCWKKIITKSVLGRDLNSNINITNSDNSGPSKENVDILMESTSEMKKEVEKKVRKKKPKPPTRPKSERVAQRTPRRTQINEVENQSSFSRNATRRVNNSNLNSEPSLEEPSLQLQTNNCNLNSISMMQQANTMSELATYKKQFYDALLSIQRAKVAVANSLAISSVGNTSTYNPYYLNYLRRQQQLMQHHQRCFMRTQFSTLRSAIPNNQSVSNSWTNSSNWRYTSFEQRIPRHSNAVFSSSMDPSTFGFLTQDTTPASTGRCGEKCEQLTPNIRKQKLEEIVGKLKEAENETVHQNLPQ